MPILEESSDVPSEDSPHFFDLDEMLKEARKFFKKVKAKGNEPPPLELNDDEKPRKVEIVIEVAASISFDVGPIKLEVGIMDKIIRNALVDGGSGLNIMLLSTMEKLSLKITGPSPYVVNMADQNGHIPIGQIAYCKVCIGDKEYNLTFHVIRLQTEINAYSLLLGQTWLQLAEATTNWSPDNP
ncbi:hypothetical protein CY35_11G093300, partial [Sphagnum magellanicum]